MVDIYIVLLNYCTDTSYVGNDITIDYLNCTDYLGCRLSILLVDSTTDNPADLLSELLQMSAGTQCVYTMKFLRITDCW